jgi:tetratricopeptide (TPR) repeat protein
MMPKPRLTLLTLLISLLYIELCLAQGTAESKIKNGKLLAGKALEAQGDERVDLAYKAKREFDRAINAEPENAEAHYWLSVVTFYLEGDSAAADKSYAKALEYGGSKIRKLPTPRAYRSDQAFKAALADDFAWAKGVEEPSRREVVEKPVEEPKLDPVKLLGEAVKSGQFIRAESIYSDLAARPDMGKKAEVMLAGLETYLALDSIDEASALLERVEDEHGRRSKPFRNGQEAYDRRLDAALAEAKPVERRGEFAAAEAMLAKWEPMRSRPTTPARGRLILFVTSLALSQAEPTRADSTLEFYNKLGYERTDTYRNIRERLALAAREPEPPPTETRVVAEIPPAPRATSENYVTISPPSGEIVKVIINAVDPATGDIKSSELWETSGPAKLKTGSAYRLTVLKKQERKVPRYIALAGILATFLMVR